MPLDNIEVSADGNKVAFRPEEVELIRHPTDPDRWVLTTDDTMSLEEVPAYAAEKGVKAEIQRAGDGAGWPTIRYTGTWGAMVAVAAEFDTGPLSPNESAVDLYSAIPEPPFQRR